MIYLPPWETTCERCPIAGWKPAGGRVGVSAALAERDQLSIRAEVAWRDAATEATATLAHASGVRLRAVHPVGWGLLPARYEWLRLFACCDAHAITLMAGGSVGCLEPRHFPARCRADDLGRQPQQARQALDTAYGWLEPRLQGRTWAAGDSLSLADCAAAPSLFYADWVHPIGPAFPTVRAYRSRLLAWPAFARVVDEARPFRPYFPLGAPQRD